MADENPSEPPASKPFKFLSQLLSARGFILGTAAIITAGASWFKTPDTTATKAAYEVLVTRINELSKDNETNHNDLQSFIRAYIGVTKGEVPQGVASIASSASSVGPLLPLTGPQLVPLIRKKKPIDYFTQALGASPASSAEPMVRGDGVQAAPVIREQANVAPTLEPREPIAALPSFDQVVQQASSKKK
jgi:hypothetical protein